MCEAEVVGLNPGNAGKNRATCDLRRERGGKKKRFFLIFIHAANIYFSTQKNDARHLCVDISAGLRLPYVTG